MCCTQRYTSLVDDADAEMRSFVECGGTSIGAVLIAEDVQQTFNIRSSVDDDSGRHQLSHLVDMILHESLNDVIKYISSQLSGISAAAAADDDDDDDENTLTAKSMSRNVVVKSYNNLSIAVEISCTSVANEPSSDVITRCHSEHLQASSSRPVKRRRINSTSTNINSTCTALDELGTLISCRNDDDNDDDNDDRPVSISCHCQTMLSSRCHRVFCTHCYLRMTAPVHNYSK